MKNTIIITKEEWKTLESEGHCLLLRNENIYRAHYLPKEKQTRIPGTRLLHVGYADDGSLRELFILFAD